MSESDFDKHWRKSLQDYESPMDTSRFWKHLEPKLPVAEKAKRGPFWWFMLPMGLLVAIIAGGLYFQWGLTTFNNGDGVLPAETPKAAPLNKEATPSQELISPPTANVESEIITLNDNQDARPSITTSRPPEAIPNRFLKAASAPEASSDNTLQSGLLQETNSRVSGVPVDLASNQTTEDVQPVDGLGVATNPQNGSDALSSSSISTSNPPLATITPESFNTDLLSTGIHPLSVNPLALQEEIAHHLAGATPVMSGSPWQMSVDLLGGPGFPSRSMVTSRPGMTDYVMNRRTAEHNLEAWSIGADVRFYSPKGVFFQGGIRQHRIIERFDWQRTESTFQWVEADGFLIDDSGNSQPWSATTWQEQTRTQRIRHHNQLTTWDIPLMVGYRHVWGTWSGDIALGMMVNLSQEAQGRSIDLEGNPAYWGEADALTYKDNIGLSGGLQGRLVYNPSPAYGIFIQPTWQLFPGNRVDSEASGYELQYNLFYLQTGVSLNIF